MSSPRHVLARLASSGINANIFPLPLIIDQLGAVVSSVWTPMRVRVIGCTHRKSTAKSGCVRAEDEGWVPVSNVITPRTSIPHSEMQIELLIIQSCFPRLPEHKS